MVVINYSAGIKNDDGGLTVKYIRRTELIQLKELDVGQVFVIATAVLTLCH